MNKPIPFHEGALVVTSISAPNDVLQELAKGCAERSGRFIVVGDSKSPSDFHLEGCEFYSIERQQSLPFQYAQACPERSYTRKNIGYLLAIQGGARFVVETDDDNFPLKSFWDDRDPLVDADGVDADGWVNAYSYFADTFIYPRGFPLDKARAEEANRRVRLERPPTVSLIQQGLADGNPDVDAVYRMLYPLPFDFNKGRPLILGKKAWCPFNSQNTTFFPEAYPLLYLPAFCSFRMTDIWRSFVAQRILWNCESGVSFHQATVFQERNEHSLIKDFEDEIPGYLNNQKIAEVLEKLNLKQGVASIPDNMTACYESLCSLGVVGSGEMSLLELWLQDIAHINR